MNASTAIPTPLGDQPTPGGRRPRRWRSLTALMIAVALIGIGLGIYDHWNRVEVVIVNLSNETIPRARILHERGEIVVGPIRPGGQITRRIRPAMYGAIDVSFTDGDPDGIIPTTGLGRVGKIWKAGEFVRFTKREDGSSAESRQW